MRKKDLTKRLAVLESQLNFTPERNEGKLLLYLISYHVGGWRLRNNESVAEGCARAMGYQNSHELYVKMMVDLNEFNDRRRCAAEKMFANERVDMQHAPNEVVRETLLRLIVAAEQGGMSIPEI